MTRWLIIMGGVLVAGAGGAVVRDVLGQWLGHPRGMDWANRGGALVLGAMTAAAVAGTVDPAVALVVGGGFCGGLTTFSTLVVTAIEEGRPGLAGRETVVGLALAAVAWLATASLVS